MVSASSATTKSTSFALIPLSAKHAAAVALF